MTEILAAIAAHLNFMYKLARPACVPGIGGDIQAWFIVSSFCVKRAEELKAKGDHQGATFFVTCAMECELKVANMVIDHNAAIDAQEKKEVPVWKS